jgi:tetratricopeptide (TPR) repeat protein/serine/threonine protein kinase
MVATYAEGDEPVPGFRLVQLLGWGRFGEVWKASAPGGFEAAVKLINLSNSHGLNEFRAIQLFKQIRHPNIVPLMALWLKDKHGHFIDAAVVDDPEILQEQAAELIIAMGMGDKSLYDRLQECREAGLVGIPKGELIGYMEQVAGALDHLNQPVHDLGKGPASIQHCDVKPHNILKVGNSAQLCDLGVARLLQDLRATAAMGSAAYIAPECIQSGKPSQETDQYSLAISYVELRTGSLPFDAKTVAAAYLAHLHGRLDLSRLPAPEQEVIARATAVQPEERFPCCVAFTQALRLAAEQSPQLPTAPRLVHAGSAVARTEPLSTAVRRDPPAQDRSIRDTDRFPRPSARGAARGRAWSPDENSPESCQLGERDTPGPAATLPDDAPTASPRSTPKSLPSLLLQPESPAPAVTTPADASTWPVLPNRGQPSRPGRKKTWLIVMLAAALPVLLVPGRLLFSSPAPPNLDLEPLALNDPPTPAPAPVVPVVEPPADPPEVPPPARPDPHAAAQRGKTHAERGEFKLAAADYTEALRLDDELPDVYSWRAAARLELGEYDDAIADATAALRLNPADFTAHHTRAVAALRKGDWEQARTECEAAIQLAPRFADAFRTRADASWQQHRYDQAAADYAQAIELNPADTRAHFLRTEANARLGKLDPLIKEASEAIRRDPKNAVALAERGHAYLLKGRLDQAIADCTAALQLNPDYAAAHGTRGECHRRKGDANRAITDCTTAVELDPSLEQAYLYRGAAYLDKDSLYDRAITDFTRALQLDPFLVDAYLKRGAAHAIQGQYAESRRDYQKARELNERFGP